MFDKVEARFILRAGLASVLAGLAVSATIWIDNPIIQIASASLGVLGAYMGVGVAVPVVEPSIGNKMKESD